MVVVVVELLFPTASIVGSLLVNCTAAVPPLLLLAPIHQAATGDWRWPAPGLEGRSRLGEGLDSRQSRARPAGRQKGALSKPVHGSKTAPGAAGSWPGCAAAPPASCRGTAPGTTRGVHLRGRSVGHVHPPARRRARHAPAVVRPPLRPADLGLAVERRRQRHPWHLALTLHHAVRCRRVCICACYAYK